MVPTSTPWIDSESVLHWDLQKKGHSLFLDPSAQVSHMNFGTLSSILPSQFLSGQVFAASRASTWTALQRLKYILGAPVIPLVRLRRILDQTRRSEHWHVLPAGVIPMLLLALIASALGELMDMPWVSGKRQNEGSPCSSPIVYGTNPSGGDDPWLFVNLPERSKAWTRHVTGPGVSWVPAPLSASVEAATTSEVSLSVSPIGRGQRPSSRISNLLKAEPAFVAGILDRSLRKATCDF